MNINNVKLVYFSPTGTNKAVLESIAQGLAVDTVDHVNLTYSDALEYENLQFDNDVVLLAAPVYAGRIPLTAIERFKEIKANNSSAVVVVVYGNRAFDDALLELKELADSVGFNVIAGGAFIGEHSFATDELPIANFRPDADDLIEAVTFGQKVRNKIDCLDSLNSVAEFAIPGNHPYKERPPAKNISPVSNGNCKGCGLCVDLCPTGAIFIDGKAVSDSELCILCSACIKGCPTAARQWENEGMLATARRLNENCSERREPEVFGV